MGAILFRIGRSIRGRYLYLSLDELNRHVDGPGYIESFYAIVYLSEGNKSA